MGEDRTMCAEKKPNDVISPCRHRHSSVISSCSEDAESESTSAGYPPSPDEEREGELEYGPGIVNKLRTRFLSITLKQTRGSNMRRSCSMENLLDQDRPLSRTFPVEKTPGIMGCGLDSAPVKLSWGNNLKRAKSMDTLLMEMNPGPDLQGVADDHKAPKVVKTGLNRLVPTICDEELPKPDTVKTYKRMFEPAESRRGYHCRRPPVLRASARSSSGSKVNGVSPSPSAKVNGTTTSPRSKFSAKQSPPVKAQSPDPAANGSGKKPLNGESSRPLYNGCHVVKATPVKINNLRNGKEVDNLNSINRLLCKKEVHFAPKTDIISNGNGTHKEILKVKSNEEIVKQFTKNTLTNGNVKPKVPPNRPSLRSPKPPLKANEQKPQDVITPTKQKPVLANGLKKPCEINNKSDLPKSPEPKSNDVSKIPREIQLKNHIKSPPPESKQKDDFAWPPEHKSKDPPPPIEDNAAPEVKCLPENSIKADLSPTIEKTIKDKIDVKDVIQPQEKEPIIKTTERTASVSPDLNNSDKSLKLPSVPPPKVLPGKPVNGITEPLKTTNRLVDPVKKLMNVSCTDKSPNKSTTVPLPCVPEKKLVNGFTEPIKKTVNGLAEPPAKKLVNGLAEPANKSVNVLAEPVTKSMNGLTEPAKKSVNGLAEPVIAGKSSKQTSHESNLDVKRPIKKSQAQTTSMVFDFRGKDVVPHVAVLPVPFGCKALHPKKRVDGKEVHEDDDEDEDYVDYSVPPPSGVTFEGENVKIGRGSILATRNKDLKITFDDDVDGNTFVYPSETSLLEDPERSSSTSANEVIPNGQPPPPNSKLKTNTSIGSSSAGGLATYTPSVLRTMDNFEPGMFRPPASPSDKDQPDNRASEEEENTEVVRQGDEQDLKPADPDIISSWSLSAGTSDLLF